MDPIILFRNSYETKEEFEIANNYPLVQYRSLIPNDSLVIGRYSVLPFYKELEQELKLKNCRLINNWQEHNYIADIENWYSDLKEFTPETWFDWKNLFEGSYVVKGRTNSRKFQWNNQMFAATLKDVTRVASNLLYDQLIAPQGLCVREYIPLKQFDIVINGLPITNEWRCFYYREILLSVGFYWSNFEEYKPYEKLPLEAINLLNKVSYLVSQHTNFYVVDIAEKTTGEWIVIELNDGQMSGLSMNNPDQFYSNLLRVIS